MRCQHEPERIVELTQFDPPLSPEDSSLVELVEPVELVELVELVGGLQMAVEIVLPALEPPP